MSDTQNLIKEFMSKKRFAVVGATDNQQKTGYFIVKNLKQRGYEVYPVNPKVKEIDGLTCYPTLSAIPAEVEVVDFVVPPAVTETVLKECHQLGLKRIWLQPGAESPAAIEYCRNNDMQVVYNDCVMRN